MELTEKQKIKLVNHLIDHPEDKRFRFTNREQYGVYDISYDIDGFNIRMFDNRDQFQVTNFMFESDFPRAMIAYGKLNIILKEICGD